MTNLDTHELAWAAGFFDGEGSTLHPNPTKGGRTIRVSIGQRTPELLERFKAAVGVGRIYGPYFRGPQRYQIYLYTACGLRMSQAVIAMLWKWLGRAKKDQYKLALKKAGMLNAST